MVGLERLIVGIGAWVNIKRTYGIASSTIYIFVKIIKQVGCAHYVNAVSIVVDKLPAVVVIVKGFSHR